MEKRNYVKPVINENIFQPSSFIAASQEIFDTEEEITTLVNILDGCFRLKNGDKDNVTNEELISYMSTHSSICITVGAPQDGETCNYGYTTENEGYTLTYSNNVFTLTKNSSCDGRDIVNIGSSSSDKWH